MHLIGCPVVSSAGKVPFPPYLLREPERRACHPKGRSEAEDAPQGALTRLERRLSGSVTTFTDSVEEPHFT